MIYDLKRKRNKGGLKSKICITMDSDLVAFLDGRARAFKLTRSGLINRLCVMESLKLGSRLG